MTSCTDSVTPKAFVQFIKNGENGYTQTFHTADGETWVATYAPKEYMAVNTLKKNNPTAAELEAAVSEYSDMIYFILRNDNPTQTLPFDCQSFFMADCNSEPVFAPLMGQTVLSGQNEFLLGFPAALAECPNDICLYSATPEKRKIGCFAKDELKTLPHIKPY